MLKLENHIIVVEMNDIPVIKEFFHKSSGARIIGGSTKGCLKINGKPYGWDEWKIKITQNDKDKILIYELEMQQNQVIIGFEFKLEDTSLNMEFKVISDPQSFVETVEWQDTSVISCCDMQYMYWREEMTEVNWDFISGGGRGVYNVENEGFSRQIGYAVPDGRWIPAVHACFNNGKVCCFVYSDYPVLPLKTHLFESSKYPGRCDEFALSLNTYQYKVRNKIMAPLNIKIVFLEDINQDNIADECDYHLWLNRQFPDPNTIYKEALWYKIECADVKGRVLTDFKQVEKIIEFLYNITDGLPQIVYLVGWQHGGNDGGYPSLDRIYGKLDTTGHGAKKALHTLFETVKKRYNCILSYHANVDDAYCDSKDFELDCICRDVDGTPMKWLEHMGRVCYHICHTKDVESDRVFKRIDDMLNLVPVEKTIHLDAFRMTNYSWEPDGFIGAIEELECGVRPIIEYFKQRGIDVSTEGINGMPIEPAGLFCAFWHIIPSAMNHGKILGGGLRVINPVTCGIGTSIDDDLNYDKVIDNWSEITDAIYLGWMLYRFYLQRELLESRKDKNHIKLRFDGGVITNIDMEKNTLKVEWNDLVIARNDDRFIPMDNCIYLYSKNGCEQEWKLPYEWQEVPLNIYTLNREGRGQVPYYCVRNGHIAIKLLPHTPVKIVRA